MSRSLTFCLETKTLWRQTSSRKKVPTNAYQDQRNTGFSKVTLCEIFKVRSIESLKHIPPVCYSDDTPRNMTLNETNGDWLFDMSVKRPHGRALANECSWRHVSEAAAPPYWYCPLFPYIQRKLYEFNEKTSPNNSVESILKKITILNLNNLNV